MNQIGRELSENAFKILLRFRIRISISDEMRNHARK